LPPLALLTLPLRGSGVGALRQTRGPQQLIR